MPKFVFFVSLFVFQVILNNVVAYGTFTITDASFVPSNPDDKKCSVTISGPLTLKGGPAGKTELSCPNYSAEVRDGKKGTKAIVCPWRDGVPHKVVPKIEDYDEFRLGGFLKSNSEEDFKNAEKIVCDRYRRFILESFSDCYDFTSFLDRLPSDWSNYSVERKTALACGKDKTKVLRCLSECDKGESPNYNTCRTLYGACCKNPGPGYTCNDTIPGVSAVPVKPGTPAVTNSSSGTVSAEGASKVQE